MATQSGSFSRDTSGAEIVAEPKSVTRTEGAQASHSIENADAPKSESDSQEKGGDGESDGHSTKKAKPPPLDVTAAQEYQQSTMAGPKTPTSAPPVTPGQALDRRKGTRERKIGHRRVDEEGQITFKKIQTSQIMASIQLGIGYAVGKLASKPERDLLMQDFTIVETTAFPHEGSNLTPAHHYSDFKFKAYAPVAFRYFRDLFGIQPEDFLCGGKNIHLVVMNNLLPSSIKLHEKYDLKGSTYKRKASKSERKKQSPTYKDLDYMEKHPDGTLLEHENYNALVKTIQRDCRVLESFKIMDYSLLLGIHNVDLAKREKMEQRMRQEDADGNGRLSGESGSEWLKVLSVSNHFIFIMFLFCVICLASAVDQQDTEALPKYVSCPQHFCINRRKQVPEHSDKQEGQNLVEKVAEDAMLLRIRAVMIDVLDWMKPVLLSDNFLIIMLFCLSYVIVRLLLIIGSFIHDVIYWGYKIYTHYHNV